MRVPSMVPVAALSSMLSLTACLTAAHGPAKAQEAAMDMNVNARFGRMELATEKVSPKGRTEFLEHRKSWGGRVRVADTELAGLHMVDEDNAEVTVKVAWYATNEQELRVTTLRQKWHDFKGDWRMVGEARTDGDVGLIGEKVAPPSAERPKNAQFPAVRLGASPEPKADPDPEPPTTAAADQ